MSANASMDAKEPQYEESRAPSTDGEIVNASGHKQELERNFGLWSIVGLVLSSGNTWLALGGSLTVAIYSGGPCGVIYQFITVSILYWCIAASLAELASAMPSAGGVYHWASITAGKYGRVVGWFAGWTNFLAWIFGLASSFQLLGIQIVSMYALYHPEYTPERWHVLIVYLLTCWITCGIVLTLNRALPHLETFGGILAMAGFFITVLVCAILPGSSGRGYATTASVWREWSNATGWSSDGLAYCLGMLNGAYAVGTPDVSSHLAEEIPRPGSNIPKAILIQYVVGFVTGFTYLIAMFYGITDLNSVLESPLLFPLGSIYQQATGSTAGGVGLLVVAFLPCVFAMFGLYLTTSRVFWTLARDNATPFSKTFGQIHPKYKTPFNAIILCAAISTALAIIYVGNSTAFTAFIGSFVILTMISYLLAIGPHLINKRSCIVPGRFWMPGAIGFIVNGISCLFIMAFIVIFCFPFALPVDATTMNYASLLAGGLSLFVAAYWFFKQKEYVGPRYVPVSAGNLEKDAV